MPTQTERPLTVLIAADTYPPDINGAAQFGHRLAMGMRDRGHEVHVVAARTGAGPSYTIDIDGITEHRLRSHHPPTHPYYRLCFPWEMQHRVGRILDEVRPDVVHIQCHYIVGRMLAWAAQRRGIRLVATNHFMPENLNPFLPFPDWFLRGFAKLSWKDMEHVLGRAEVITTPTPIGARSMHEHGFAKPILPVSNGIDSAAYELRPGERVEEPAHPTILFTGRLAVEKNVDVLIRALALHEVRLRDWWRVALREVPTGLVLGTILGAIGIVRIVVWQKTGLYDYGEHWILLAITIGAALVGIVTFGSLSGSMLPFILKRLGFDPASASAPS